MSLLWDLSGINNQGLDLKILTTEIDQRMINRAQKGCYPLSSIRELPSEMRSQAFTRKGDLFCIKEQYRKRVQFLQQDIRNAQPDSTFDLILCRNLVLTYFSIELQEEIVQRIIKCLNPGGYLIIGSHEELPLTMPSLTPWLPKQKIYLRED